MNFENSTYNDFYKNIIFGQVKSCFCKKSFLRLLNAFADFPVDVHVNEIVMGENIKSGSFTKYVQFNPGKYSIKIFKANEPTSLIFESEISIQQNLAYTGILAVDDNDKSDISILMIPEEKDSCIKGKMSSVKLANLLLDSTETELLDNEGTVWFSGLDYGDVSRSVAIPSGKYNIELRDKKNKKSILKIMNVDLVPKMHYTIYLTGQKDEPKIIIPQDGVNYLELC